MLHDAFLWWDVWKGEERPWRRRETPFGGVLNAAKPLLTRFCVAKSVTYPPSLPDPPRTSPKPPPLMKRKFDSLSECGGGLGEVFVVWGGAESFETAAIARWEWEEIFWLLFVMWVPRSRLRAFTRRGHRRLLLRVRDRILVFGRDFLAVCARRYALPRSRLRAPLRGSTARLVGVVLFVFLSIAPLRSG